MGATLQPRSLAHLQLLQHGPGEDPALLQRLPERLHPQSRNQPGPAAPQRPPLLLLHGPEPGLPEPRGARDRRSIPGAAAGPWPEPPLSPGAAGTAALPRKRHASESQNHTRSQAGRVLVWSRTEQTKQNSVFLCFGALLGFLKYLQRWTLHTLSRSPAQQRSSSSFTDKFPVHQFLPVALVPLLSPPLPADGTDRAPLSCASSRG